MSKTQSRLGLWVLGFGILAASSGCAKARAELVADGPPLEVPAPPPRVIAPIDDTLAATPQPLDPTIAVTPRLPAPPQARGTQRRTVENEGREPAAPPAPAATTAPAASPEPRELRPASAAAAAEIEKKVRSLMGQAMQTLAKVNYRTLSVENKAQYDEAKRFVERAEDAINRDRNFAYAETFADKAVTLATQLVGR